MLIKIFREASFLVASVALTFSIYFAGVTISDAATPGFTPPDNYRKDDVLGMGSDLSDDVEEDELKLGEMGMEDIFGSEQVFPFEMGLGNSAF